MWTESTSFDLEDASLTIGRLLENGSRTARLSLAVAVLAVLATAGIFATRTAGASGPGAELPECAPGVEFIGFSDALNKTAFGGFNVTELSGLTYDKRNKQYYVVSDRSGPTSSHVFTIKIPFGRESLKAPVITDVNVLKDDTGTPYTGFVFDGEGIVRTSGGDLIVSSEGGSGAGQNPEIKRFSTSGAQLADLAVPPKFLIGTNNLTFESLTLAPAGRSLFTINEGPLAVDGRTAELRSRLRIIRYTTTGGGEFAPVAEYFYMTEPGRTLTDVGVVEMIALSRDELLVMERGFVAGLGNTVRIFRVSLEGAADVSGEPTLGAPGLVPVSKELMVDVVNCPSAGATTPQVQPNPLLDNYEAMALGPRLPGGRRALILVSDDNESLGQVTRVVALAVPVRDLAGNEDD